MLRGKKWDDMERNEIAFKEKDEDNQFYRDENGVWIKCNEDKIDELHMVWLMNYNGNSIRAKDGDFYIYDYKKV